jgi:superfamily I DNA/RNA helicase
MAKISLGTIELDLSPGSVILGAPGAGKTSALLELVAALEQQGANPDEILVLTPSRLAANKLRDQIALQSTTAARNPRARSVASFAFSILAEKNPDLKLLSGASQQALIAELIQDSLAKKQHLIWGVDQVTCELLGFQAEVRDLLSVVIENELDLEALAQLQAQFKKTKLQVAQDLLPGYREALTAQNALDPSELLVEAVAALKESTPPKYLVVDDAQDLSPAAVRLVAEISKQASTFIFGDPDAAVMGFRSASESFLASFPLLAQKVLPQPETRPEKLWLL